MLGEGPVLVQHTYFASQLISDCLKGRAQLRDRKSSSVAITGATCPCTSSSLLPESEDAIYVFRNYMSVYKGPHATNLGQIARLGSIYVRLFVNAASNSSPLIMCHVIGTGFGPSLDSFTVNWNRDNSCRLCTRLVSSLILDARID